MAGKILVVDDGALNRILMNGRLSSGGYATVTARDGASALQALASDPPDLAVLGNRLPDMPGLDLLAAIRRDPRHAALPVILAAADCAIETRLAAFAAGADEVIARQPDEADFLARVRSLLRRIAGGAAPAGSDLHGMADPASGFDRPGRIALALHDPDQCQRLARDLSRFGGHAALALGRPAALALPPDAPVLPEAFVLDDKTPAGLHFISELRTRPASQHSGVILICDHPERVATAFDMGADEVLPATTDPQELALRLAALLRRTRLEATHRKAMQHSARLAGIDTLTGLHNRRHADTELPLIAGRARSTGLPYALLFLDLDRFKQVNDTHGHAAGDLVLLTVARHLAATLRPGDMLARFGGDEFLLALPGLDAGRACALAKALCDSVQRLDIRIADGTAITVTVSIGIAAGNGHEAVADLCNRADQAMLGAKARGRGRIALDPGNRAA